MKKITVWVLSLLIAIAMGVAPAIARKVEVSKSAAKVSFEQILERNEDDADGGEGVPTKVAATCLGLIYSITTKKFSCMDLACNDGVRFYMATDLTTGASKQIQCDVDCPVGAKPDADGTCECTILTSAQSPDSDPECHE